MADDTGIPFGAELNTLEDGFAERGGEIFRTVINFQTTLNKTSLAVAAEEDLKALGEEELVLIEAPFVKGLPGEFHILLDKSFTAKVVDFMIMGEGDVEFMPEEHLDGIVEAISQLLGNELTELGGQLGVSLRNEVKPARLLTQEEWTASYAGWTLVQFDIQIEGQDGARLIKLLSPELAAKLGEMLGGEAPQPEATVESDDLDEDGFPKPKEPGEMTQDSGTGTSLDQSAIDAMLKGGGHNVRHSKPEPAPQQEDLKDVRQASFADLGAASAQQKNSIQEKLTDSGLARILDLRLPVVIELGRTRMLIKDIVELTPGSVIELNKLVGEPVDLFVNGTRFAQGEVVVIDENFGVRLTELIPLDERLKQVEGAS